MYIFLLFACISYCLHFALYFILSIFCFLKRFDQLWKGAIVSIVYVCMFMYIFVRVLISTVLPDVQIKGTCKFICIYIHIKQTAKSYYIGKDNILNSRYLINVICVGRS